MGYSIDAVDFHRNGVGGDGFYVGIITEPDENDRRRKSRKLVIAFPEIGQCAVAVLDLDKAAAGNIHMHPRLVNKSDPDPREWEWDDSVGGNAWRGDHYAWALEAFPRWLESPRGE
jgi:hypothetical protein